MTDRLALAVAELVDALRAEVRAERKPDAPPALLDVESAAHRLGIGRTTLFELIRRGEVRVLRVGRRTLIPASAIAEYTANGKGAGANGTPPAAAKERDAIAPTGPA